MSEQISDQQHGSPAESATQREAQRDERQKKIGERSGSCVPYFDALWFCYSPVHQMKEYYRYGSVDDCTGHWGKLMDCLKLKTTRYKDSVPEDPSNGKHPLWELRTPQQASEFWRAEFGHLWGDAKTAEGAGAAAPEEAAAAGPEGAEAPRRASGRMV